MITGWTLAFGLLVCIGVPMAFMALIVALFFYAQHQRERRHQEMLAAQYSRNQPPVSPI